jgi:hypothetical protein
MQHGGMMAIRRVVTGVRDGKSVILADGEPANFHEFVGWPGHATSLVWATAPISDLPLDMSSEPQLGQVVTPGPGETRLLVVRFPPDAVFADPRFDGIDYGAEATVHLPGLIERFEADNPGMHTTESIDYDVVLNGEIWLELDDGVETMLQQGDILVQGGTRHAWRNKSNSPTTMLFVLVGARGNAC